MIEIQNLNFSYENPDQATLSNLTIKLKTNQKISIIGESGSGKTTLLKALNGKLDYEGEIIYNKERLKKRSEALIPGHEEVKLIDQHYQLHKNITVLENLELQLRSYNHGFTSSRIKKLTKAFKLKSFLHKKVENISGGEKQRVAIANALATIPKVILLDEPFNNLDFNLRSQAMDFLDEEITENQSTAILVSHRPDEILSFSNQVIVMRKGKVIQKGTPFDIFFKPKTEYTAGLLGEYNLLDEKIPNAHIVNQKSLIRPINNPFSKTLPTIKSVFLGDKYKNTLSNNTITYQSTNHED